MRSSWMAAAIVMLIGCLPCAGDEPEDAAANWPQWRGPLGTGVSPTAAPPRAPTTVPVWAFGPVAQETRLTAVRSESVIAFMSG